MGSIQIIIIKLKKITEFLISWYFWKVILGIVTGGSAGFLYYHFIGCTSGSCPVTSHPYSAIAAGGLMGYLLSGIL
jgi:hypothetical protein